ncbi:MAG: hypothetical protein U1B30_02625 [Pseudomonadota bacterium]|nr:hypothetical protein [Pseudomonadota bacterium]
MTIEPAALRGNQTSGMASRWIYVFMAAVFVVITIIGFYPTSTGLLAAVSAGQRPPPPLVLHIHAASMAAWFALFLTQTILMATDRHTLHKTLGLIFLGLVPIMVLSSVAVVLGMWSVSAPPEFLIFISKLLLVQTQSLCLFLLFIGWAIWTRKKDGETHKRMMLLATLMLMGVAIGRIVDGIENLGTALIAQILLLTPVFIYDKVRLGYVHRAYLIGATLYVVTSIPVYFFWNSPWWLDIAPKLMGIR